MLCSAVIAALAATLPSGSKPVVLTVEDGQLVGQMNGSVAEFLGVPFAEPPVGPLRWQPPAAAQPWSTPRLATRYAPSCMQKKNGFTELTSISEDCLYFNLWMPQEALAPPVVGGRKWPVMIFFYGGSWDEGSAMCPLYDGKALVAHNQSVIAIAANYRLNAFGFLGHDKLRGADGSTGNFGLQDQRAAMAWVRDNAARLSADPDNVMIFGESAGSGSVANHLVHEQSWPLFDKAGMESGPFADWSSQPLDMASTRAEALATRVGCDPAAGSAVLAACLRGANESAIEAAAHGLPDSDLLCDWSPVIDGVELTDEPQRLAAAGKLKRGVPTLLGTNHDEGTEFVSFPLNGTQRDFDAYAAANVKGYGSQVVGAYPLSDYPKTTYASPGWWAASGVMGDSQMSCPARRTARWIEAAGGTPYLYFLTHKLVLADAVELKTKKPLGVFHGTDLGFVFKFKPLLSATEEALADVIIGYWTSFAVDGVPSSPGQVAWPAYAAATDQNLNLNLVPSIQTGLKSDLCAFWDTVTQNKTARGV